MLFKIYREVISAILWWSKLVLLKIFLIFPFHFKTLKFSGWFHSLLLSSTHLTVAPSPITHSRQLALSCRRHYGIDWDANFIAFANQCCNPPPPSWTDKNTVQSPTCQFKGVDIALSSGLETIIDASVYCFTVLTTIAFFGTQSQALTPDERQPTSAFWTQLDSALRRKCFCSTWRNEKHKEQAKDLNFDFCILHIKMTHWH